MNSQTRHKISNGAGSVIIENILPPVMSFNTHMPKTATHVQLNNGGPRELGREQSKGTMGSAANSQQMRSKIHVCTIYFCEFTTNITPATLEGVKFMESIHS